MIDHILGRPDPRFRKYQVFTVVLLWSIYLYKGDRHGPPVVRKLSSFVTKRLTAWQALVTAFLCLYVSSNGAKVLGLVSPEPLANMYTRDYFRASYFAVAMDAGFWTCMNIRPVWLRDIASIGATIYYLFRAEQADVMVKKVLGCIDIDFMRVSWEKSQTPYLKFATELVRPRFMRTKPRKIIIHRPPWSEYKEPISAWLYFDGPIEHLKRHDKIILDIPGGGFVAMNPRCHDDKLLEWAGKSGLPVVALDYRKAPEFPYPYALNECYDAYCELVRTKGRCVGLAGDVEPKIVVAGDSAGGNLAAGMVLMLLQKGRHRGRRAPMPIPEGLVMVYPALDVNMSNWMSPTQVDLLRKKSSVNRGVLQRKDEDYRRLQPRSHSRLFGDEEDDSTPPERRPSTTSSYGLTELADTQVEVDPLRVKRPFKTSLAMSSIISYFDDRVLSPNLMRSMLLLYVGEHNQPDFATDYLLSPLLAPDELLAGFPKVYMLTGERDPLSDDTVLFAGRLRQAHEQRFFQRQDLGLESEDKVFNAAEHVEYVMIPGISHGFLQFVNFYPTGWKYIAQCRHWIMEIFTEADKRSAESTKAELLQKQLVVDVRRASENDLDSEASTSPIEMSRPNHNPGDLETSDDKRKAQKTAQIYSSGRRSPASQRRALSRMASSDNIIDRRMKGLTMGLMGQGVKAEPEDIRKS